MDWREEQKICKKYNLRQCSMGRCCNAEQIQKLRTALREIVEFGIKDKRSTDSEEMIRIALKALK
jgi:hypothetical protein